MYNYIGINTEGSDFYNLLLKSEEFTCELGKAVLASGKLEAVIILYFSRLGVSVKPNSPLGSLISRGEKLNILDVNLCMALKQTNLQRIEFFHKIYSLFIKMNKEDLLPINNLLDSDVVTYI
jgi:hypothetical protein